MMVIFADLNCETVGIKKIIIFIIAPYKSAVRVNARKYT